MQEGSKQHATRPSLSVVPKWNVVIPVSILTRCRSAVEIACYVSLVSFADEAGKCFPSYESVADRAKCSRRTAIRAIQRLEQEGLVAIESRVRKSGGDSSNGFFLPSHHTLAGCHPVTPRSANAAPPGVPMLHPAQYQSVTPTLTSPIRNDSHLTSSSAETQKKLSDFSKFKEQAAEEWAGIHDAFTPEWLVKVAGKAFVSYPSLEVRGLGVAMHRAAAEMASRMTGGAPVHSPRNYAERVILERVQEAQG
jgi:hypothetical protein